MLDDAWWKLPEAMHAALVPMVVTHRVADGNAQCMGKLYYHMHQADELLKTEGDISPELRKQLCDLHAARWDYMHNRYMAAGYAARPRVHRPRAAQGGGGD